jgi:phospholipid/cholesterol/gamma-HCH transport system permease protein
VTTDFRWLTTTEDAGHFHLRPLGAWRLAHLPDIERELGLALRPIRGASHPLQVEIDGSGLEQIDSAAALVLLRTLASVGVTDPTVLAAGPAPLRVLAQVRRHLDAAPDLQAVASTGMLAGLGRSSAALATLWLGHLNALGQTVAGAAGVLRHPRRLRLRETTVQLDQVGLAALPVVALVTLLIGVVVTYLLGLQAEQYGANIFVVDGVGIGATREFAPIIVAIIVAGRSGAAFTAQLGSMRLTEETDAIRTMGLSPLQVLVLPRVLALMLALPLLVFVGDVMSLVGAMAIAGPMLDITPAAFLARLREHLPLRHVLVGLAKAPVFALAIATIGVRMGMTVSRDTRALGAATTSTVVQSIVAVILLDAAFAVVLQSLAW